MKKKLSISFLWLIISYSGYTYYKSLTDKALFVPSHQLRHQKLISRIPDDLSFAGERVHFKDPDDYRNFYNELKINTSQNSSTRLLMMNTRIWLPQIVKVLKANNIHEDFQYVAVAESNLNNDVVSPMGAAGFWQLQAPTAIELGLEVNTEVDERYHPMKSTNAACKYFKQAHALFGSWTSAAASYNSGMNGLLQAFKKQSVNSYYDLELNHETANYIYRILSIKDLLKNPKKYGMRVKNHSVALIRKIKVENDIKDLTKFAMDNKTNIDDLKALNPWLLKNSLTIKEPGKSYILLLPAKAGLQSDLKKDTSSKNTLSNGLTSL
ncbi:MAG TPA: lytic transglycosylase domain-containing protein [Cytophagaceae bacterium]|nr:lytic transglycosylase domain-containing protein [Cytophagaceae bacterium]